MCLMTEKQTPYTDGETQQEKKSTVTDNLLLSDIDGNKDQQNETAALRLEQNHESFEKQLFFRPLLFMSNIFLRN
ncbi:Hypothetical predicted protein, partial [Mytilus galloprovincialis]